MNEELSKGMEEAAGPLAHQPDPEVAEQATRRRFTTEYKLRILEEADQCTHGEQGALLRREGLYSSHLADWRQQRAEGRLAGRRWTKDKSDLAKQLLEMERENRQLRQQLEKAETVIALQKKLSALFDLKAGNES